MRCAWIMLLGAMLSFWFIGDAATVPLKRCAGDIPNDQTGPFYCLSIGGQAFTQSISVRFDTEGRTLIMPEACLKPSSYKVIHANVEDEWGNPADIVQASVSLMAGDKPVATVANLQFFASKNGDGTCNTGYSGSSNFGAAMDLDKYISASIVNKTSKVSDSPLVCLANFMNAYAFQQPGSQYGYTLTPDASTSGGLLLTLGPINKPAPPSQQIYTTKEIVPQCGGMQNVPSFVGKIQSNWGGMILPRYNIKINGLSVPSTNAVSPYKTVMVDSGGGMMIIADDANKTILTALNHSGPIFTEDNCNASQFTFLENCSCLSAGLPVQVQGLNSVNYSYTSSIPDDDEIRAVAICPPSQQGTQNPYVQPNGANIGGLLFENNTITYDMKNGYIWVVPYKPALMSY